MDTNIIYDEKNDYLYILLYKLGSGSYATVWFSIEIKSFYKNLRTNNTNKDILCYKALKIHNEEDYDEGIMETTIKNKLTINNKKCDYINYPTSHFIHDESIVIVVYNVAIGSLYDIMKKYNYKYSKDVIDKIMPQLTESIKFVHTCGYIHTDIKPENFLIAGTNKLQNELQEYVKNYNLIKKIYNVFKKSMKIGDVLETIEPVIYKFIKDIGAKYDIIEHILPNDGSNESCEEEGGDGDGDGAAEEDICGVLDTLTLSIEE
jgi:serine/threonine protein kinase